MRILFLSNLYPPHDVGGYEQWCQEMAIALGRQGHSVHVLTSRYGQNGTGMIESDVTRSLYLQAGINHYHIGRDFALRKRRERWNTHELRRTLDQVNPDLTMVWGMWNLSQMLPDYLEQRAPNRLAYYIASYWPMDEDLHHEYWQRTADRSVVRFSKALIWRYLARQFRKEGYPPRLRLDHAACCSHCVRDTLVQAGRLPANSGVVYGGVDPEPFLARPRHTYSHGRGLRLLYFGRLLPQKGVHTAIEALGLLQKQREATGVSLTLLGDGHPEYEAELRALAARHHVDERVTFAGRVDRSDIPDWLRHFDVFLFTSTWPEPFGRTIVEAMAAGLIVIGSTVGGSKEIFEHYAPDLLFQPEDSATLASHILRVRDSQSLQRELAQRGRRVVCEHFTLQRMAEGVENWLTGLLH